MNKKKDSSSKEKTTEVDKKIKEVASTLGNNQKNNTIRSNSKEKTAHDKINPSKDIKGEHGKTLSLPGKNANDLKNSSNNLGSTSKSKLGGALNTQTSEKNQNKTTTNKTGNLESSKNNDNTAKENKVKKTISKKEIKPVIQEDPEVIQKRTEQAHRYEKFVMDSGLPVAFQIIFSELISKKIQPENFFTYTSMRLRQMGKEIEEVRGAAIVKSKV